MTPIRNYIFIAVKYDAAINYRYRIFLYKIFGLIFLCIQNSNEPLNNDPKKLLAYDHRNIVLIDIG